MKPLTVKEIHQVCEKLQNDIEKKGLLVYVDNFKSVSIVNPVTIGEKSGVALTKIGTGFGRSWSVTDKTPFWRDSFCEFAKQWAVEGTIQMEMGNYYFFRSMATFCKAALRGRWQFGGSKTEIDRAGDMWTLA